MDILLTPAQRRFVDRQVRTGRYKSAADVVRAAVHNMEAAGGLLDSPGLAIAPGAESDIDALLSLVMLLMARDSQEDLKELMDKLKALMAAKRKLREMLAKVNRDIAANDGCGHAPRKLVFKRGLGSERAYHRASLPVLDPDTSGGVRLQVCDLYPGKIDELGQLQLIQDELTGKLDSLSELSEMTSLRLQMMMDRRSKFLETLSNIMKTASATQDTLMQNLK